MQTASSSQGTATTVAMPRLNDAVALLFCLFAASWLFVAAQPRAKTTYVAAGVWFVELHPFEGS